MRPKKQILFFTTFSEIWMPNSENLKNAANSGMPTPTTKFAVCTIQNLKFDRPGRETRAEILKFAQGAPQILMKSEICKALHFQA